VRPSCHDVDLELEPGKVVALIGHTGSGKTTLASLVRVLRRAVGTSPIDARTSARSSSRRCGARSA